MAIKVSKPDLSKNINKLRLFSDPEQHANKVLDKLSNQAKDEIEKAHSGVMAVDRAVSKDGFTTPVEKYSDAKVNVTRKGNKFKLEVTGVNWLFYEFGAGIHFNNPRNWSTVLETGIPSGIVPIGMYGKGQGSNPTWAYDDEETQQRIITQGYGAVHGLANAINKNVSDVGKFAKEAFNDK